MLKTHKERKICDKYGAQDENGYVHCNECPLTLDPNRYGDVACKATYHWDEHEKDWVVDDYQETL